MSIPNSIEKLKVCVKRSSLSSQDRHDIKDRHTIGNCIGSDTNLFFEDETVKVNGKLIEIRRLYCQTDPLGFEGVGWVINDDINRCMICSLEFGVMRYKHHCRSCGNIVCNSCSPNIAPIYEMSELGKQRVCVQCFWGQDPVYVTHKSNSSYMDDAYESLANLTAKEENVSLYTPSPKSAASKLFPEIEQHSNEDCSRLDLITLEETLNAKRLSDLSKEDTIEQLEKEMGQLQYEKESMQRQHEEEKERLQKEVQEQLRLQHQKEKEMLQMELQMEKERLKQELEKERLERTRLQKEKDESEKINAEKERLEILKRIEEEKIKAENEKLEMLKRLEEEKIKAERIEEGKVKAEKERLEMLKRIEEEKMIAERIEEGKMKAEKERLEILKRLEDEKTKAEMERLEMLKRLEDEKIKAENEKLELLKRLEEEKIKAENERLEMLKRLEDDEKEKLQRIAEQKRFEEAKLLKNNENNMEVAEKERQERRDSQKVKRKSILAAIVDHEGRLDEEKEKDKIRTKSSELQKEENARLLKKSQALENEENERIKTAIAIYEEQEKERVIKAAIELEEAERERIRIAVAVREVREKERVRLAAIELEAKEKERVRLATLALEVREREKLAKEASILEEKEREKLRLEALALEEAEKERIRQAAVAIEEAEKERLRIAAIAIEEAEKERVRLALLAIEEEEKKRINVMIEGENSKLEALQNQNRLKASRDKTRLKSVVISTKQLQMEQAAEKAAKDRSELESALQQRWKKQSDLMEKEAEEAANRKREHDLLLESALSHIEQKRDQRRFTIMQNSVPIPSLTEISNATTNIPNQRNDLSTTSTLPPPNPSPLPTTPASSSSIDVDSVQVSSNRENSSDDVSSENNTRESLKNESTSIIPIAGIVLKTIDKKTNKKVFVNVIHHSDIKYDTSTLVRQGSDYQSLIYVCELGETLDQSGSVSIVVDVILYTNYYHALVENQNELCSLVIDKVISITGLELDYDFKLPRIMGNYKVSSKNNSPPSILLPLSITVFDNRKPVNIKNDISNSKKSMKVEQPINFATPAEQREWDFFVDDGENIIAVGLIGKKNPIGLTHKRQLIMTLKSSKNGKISPRLFYVDPSTMTLKGEITFIDIKEYISKQTKTVARVTDSQNEMFEIETVDRIYSFKDLSSGSNKKGAEWWTNVINVVAKKYL